MDSRVPCDDRGPFDLVTVDQDRERDGDPSRWYRIVGQSDGTRRRRIVPHEALIQQAQAHLQIQHGKAPGDPIDPGEWAHAITRAAIAFLMD